MKRFDTSEATLAPDDIFQQDNWKETAVDILVPTREHDANGNGRIFTIPGVLYCRLVTVIRSAFAEDTAKWFHLTPFKRVWKSTTTGREQRLYDELYTSDAWNKAHDELQKESRNDGCKLERVIAGLMFWSDATHLAHFGDASAWPIYLFFGNQSKYMRACPNSRACHPIVFMPTLPPSIIAFMSDFMKKKNYNDVLTHCKRELFHAVWKVLLDEEFVEAYRDGFIVKCYDGVHRRIFPRIFTYSADYPEKVLLAGIHDKGSCPCPRCLIKKEEFSRLGLLSDVSGRLTKIRRYCWDWISAARNAIYSLGAPIRGAIPERRLKELSFVPTFNSFADILGPFGLDIFAIITVDLLHEFELGVFKSVFKHLLRLLHSISPDTVISLDKRYDRTLFNFNTC
ncbi:hypothetical protein M404DRAFT_156535 [Pisolithus tinctorius Marx 270]|uniref:Uncharacterized protein n=1 Tax=Pisolithus tinctorius Marx 270 TaxID=870435 RepID=A0A0C3IPT0_PISTI|nr:hypothetical protein M404DRAFT_156535 [Pisolithus tinctorius Marx 270]